MLFFIKQLSSQEKHENDGLIFGEVQEQCSNQDTKFLPEVDSLKEINEI